MQAPRQQFRGPRRGGEFERQPVAAEPDYNACMSAIDRITVKSGVCGGRPCIRGLRIRVKDVLDLLAAGATREEVLADYPYLEADDITAVLEFAAKQNDHPILRSA
jgi:uncharacterized protein (DUF433 family)